MFSTSNTSLIDKCICMIDDVNGDGSLLVNFIRLVTLNIATGELVEFYDFATDMSATYAPIGPTSECASIGATATLVAHREHLIGPAVWSLPPTAQAVAIVTIANAGGGTITTVDGAGALIIGTEMWSAQDGAFVILTGPIDLNLLAGDEVLVIYTELT